MKCKNVGQKLMTIVAIAGCVGKMLSVEGK